MKPETPFAAHTPMMQRRFCPVKYLLFTVITPIATPNNETATAAAIP
jgi:hypothetical protein